MKRWNKDDEEKCRLCSCNQTLQHVLSGFKVALSKGRYTYRHNKVLEVLAETVQQAANIPAQETAPKQFVSESGKEPSKVVCNAKKPGLLSKASDWRIAADIRGWDNYLDVIKETRQRPDIVLSLDNPDEAFATENKVVVYWKI